MHRGTRSRAAGFSFVELLVTIIIAGIVFAAMVPVFIQAQQQQSADNMRNVTMQVAQEKIERMRLLKYDQITQANLDDEAFESGKFGNTYVYVGGSGNSRVLSVDYVVSKVPADAPDGREIYKKVDVLVSWSGRPEPVKPARLSTLIYKQYAGAQLRRFDVGPETIFEMDGGTFTITSGPVVMDAYIAPEDIAGMNADLGDVNDPTIRRRTGYVKFTVGNQNGVEYVSEAVYAYVSGEPGHYRCTWDNLDAADGIYVFKATAFSGSQQQGTTASVAYALAAQDPPAPTGLTAFPGNGVVYLSWDTSPIGDFSHYEVYRSTGGEDFTLLAGDLPSTSYTDSGLSNGTEYSYQVRVVDVDGNAGDFCEPVTATPAIVDDVTPPTVPGAFTATNMAGTPTIKLTWTTSFDGSGIRGYAIERSPDNANWTEIAGDYPHLEYTDVGAGWNTLWYYRVRAIDNAGNASTYTPVVSARTDPIPVRTLTVTNSRGIHVYVWVQNAATGLWYKPDGTASTVKPAGTKVLKSGGQATWGSLPAGIYNVTNGEGFPPQAVDLTYGDEGVVI
jgi:type II secretory pathway pseudopilin PulG